MKEIKLEVGEIYQKPETLDVRTINCIWQGRVYYFDVGGSDLDIEIGSFRRWISRNSHAHQRHNVKLIGHYDFEKKKARAVK